MYFTLSLPLYKMVPHSMLEEDLIDRERQEEENQLLRDVSYILYTHTHNSYLLQRGRVYHFSNC